MPPRNLHAILIACAFSVICFSTSQRVRRIGVLGDAIDLINRFYIDPVDDTELVDAAMRGLTSRLDPHSEFIPAELIPAFNDVIEQQFAGVGILVEQPVKGEPVRVITPMVGSPALAAGVQAGDEIVGIAGEDVSQFEIRDITNRLRGPVGSEVAIRVRRMVDNAPQRIEIRLARQSIMLDSVVGDHRDADNRWVFRLEDQPQIGYVRITSFGERTVDEFRQALDALREDYDSLILDVRGNSGGLLNAAVEVCDDLLGEGSIVIIKKRGGVIDRQFDAQPGTRVRNDAPIVVLIDGDSASASEIVAACLQDHRRATVIGSRSFGKGTVQNVLPLQGGRSRLKLTTARYYRPSGLNIHRGEQASDEADWGVRPDEGLSVPLSDAEHEALLRHWQRVSYPVSTAAIIATAPAPAEPVTTAEPDKNAAPSDTPPTRDRQLDRAIRFLGDPSERPEPQPEEAPAPEPVRQAA